MAWRKASIGAMMSVLVLWLIPAAPSLASGPVVHTAQGDVAGVANGSVNEWLGIPYAAPPVGDLRWRAPAAPAPWSGTRDATSFGSDCIQLLPNSNKKTEGSEDCLYLNVFVPSGIRSSSKLPVMVHLHPGGNGFGAGYQTSGTFTDHGVIIVTLNYRLGAFGFIGHPLLSAENNGSSGEYGLLDQIAALKWVQTNIAAFGGNPSNVTLFGSSAGAEDAAALVASPLATGLFQKAAIQGTWWQTVSGADNQMSDAETLGKKSFKATGCTTAACLRAVPAKELVQDAGSSLNIHPWTGGQVLPQSPLQLLATHPAVPLLMGSNTTEDSSNYYDSKTQTIAQLSHQDWVNESQAVVGADNAAAARKLFPASDYDAPVWQAVALDTDADNTCWVRQYLRAAQSPAVWRYTYAHTYENDPVQGPFRSSHVYEEPLLWGAPVVYFIQHTNTPAENTLSDQLTSFWTNFAKTGNPNGAGLPTWPQYTGASGSEPTLQIDDTMTTLNKFQDAQCNFIDTLGTNLFQNSN